MDIKLIYHSLFQSLETTGLHICFFSIVLSWWIFSACRALGPFKSFHFFVSIPTHIFPWVLKNNSKTPNKPPNPTVIQRKKKSSVNPFGVFLQSAAIRSRKIWHCYRMCVCVYLCICMCCSSGKQLCCKEHHFPHAGIDKQRVTQAHPHFLVLITPSWPSLSPCPGGP